MPTRRKTVAQVEEAHRQTVTRKTMSQMIVTSTRVDQAIDEP